MPNKHGAQPDGNTQVGRVSAAPGNAELFAARMGRSRGVARGPVGIEVGGHWSMQSCERHTRCLVGSVNSTVCALRHLLVGGGERRRKKSHLRPKGNGTDRGSGPDL